jgi:hypothetical protein
MGEWFEHLPPLLGAIVVVGGFVAVTLGVGRYMVRATQRELLREHNDLAGFIFAVIGVIYAVLLGLIAVGVWERFTDAEVRTFDEASQLTDVYRDAGGFPKGAAIRADLRAYVEDVITKSWPQMERGVDSHVTDDAAERVSRDVVDLAPKTAGQIDLHAQMLAALDQSLIERDQRLGEDSSGLNGIMWTVLYIGGAVTIAFSLLFGFKANTLQFVMTGALALLIGLIIYLAMSLDFPYQGTIRVGPEAFERSLTTFSEIDAARR